MLMSYNQHPNQQHNDQHPPPPTGLTAAEMQRLRASYASRVAASGATRQSELMYSHDNSTVQLDSQRHHMYTDNQQQHERDTRGLYPSSSGAYGPGPYDYTQQQLPAAPMVQGSMLYGSSVFAHSSSNQSNQSNQPPSRQRMPVYGSASSMPPSPPSHVAVHPMSQEQHSAGSWSPMESYTFSVHGSTALHAQHQEHVHGLNEAPAMTLGGLPELRTDFHATDAMAFSSSVTHDELNDAKILHEVLQDNQGSHYQQQQQQYQQYPPQYSAMNSYPHDDSDKPSSSNSSSSMYMGLGSLSQMHSALPSAPPSHDSSYPGTMLTPSSASSSYASSPVSSLSSSGFGSSSSASASASASASTSELMLKRKPASRICRMPGCSKGIRSRGLCKGHGGGRRCLTPGCEISDQGGGHCIAHGGGKRCTVVGCQKSAQSKGLCKLHGGARRCKVPDCAKNCQVKGLCRLHYSMFAATPSSSSTSPSPGGGAGGSAAMYFESSSEQSFV